MIKKKSKDKNPFLIGVGLMGNINVKKLTVKKKKKNIYIHFVLNSKFDHSSEFNRSKNLRM